jgi:PTH1 family peptidyl-tRNA hydrolase
MEKIIVGLGNPGSEYDETRHNVGWWVVDRLAYDWGFGSFGRVGRALVSGGVRGGHAVELVKPLTFMNASGTVLAALRTLDAEELEQRLLVVTDDATRPVGGVRFRASGGAGGHNGLKSVIKVLGTEVFGRLRLGVGVPPSGMDLADWVLSGFEDDDEDRVTGLLPEMSDAVECWMNDGVREAMDRFNR